MAPYYIGRPKQMQPVSSGQLPFLWPK